MVESESVRRKETTSHLRAFYHQSEDIPQHPVVPQMRRDKRRRRRAGEEKAC